MSIELTPTRQEVREHNILFSPLVAPQHNKDVHPVSRRTRQASSMGMIPAVVIESRETREDRRRRSKRAFCRKYGFSLCMFLGMLFVMEKLDNWFSLEAWVDVYPVSIQRDYSTVQAIEDLGTENVDTWCHPSRSTCSCQDPLVGNGRRENTRWWSNVHKMNAEAANGKTDIDVLFLGDSITEGWMGTSRGHDIARAQGTQDLFSKFFDGAGIEAKYEGLALGISGDTSPNLLWRLQNGELPDQLNPKVIWLLIGTNDLGNTWCSSEVVLIGILRVVEELRLRKPEATIVVNGLLPRTFNRKGYVMRGRPSLLWRTPRLPSLWRDIVAVNDELRQYAVSRDYVQFFETDIFFLNKQVQREELQINSQLMPDRLHPSPGGYDRWGAQIVEILDRLITNR